MQIVNWKDDMDKSEKSYRIESIDLLRAISIMCVIIIHCVEYLDWPSLSQHKCYAQIFVVMLIFVGRLGVPFFMMISGYLILDKKFDSNQCKKFLMKKWLHLLIVTQFWYVIYNIYMYCFGKQPISIKYLLQQILFVRNVNMSHVWYMPMILGAYLIFPWLANALGSIRKSIILVPLTISVIYTYVFPFINGITKALHEEPMQVQIQMYSGGGYIWVYFVIGYLVKNCLLSNIKKEKLLILSLIMFSLAVVIQMLALNVNYKYNLWYDCPMVLVCSVCLFEIIQRIWHVKWYKVIRFLSNYSFAVYLIHNMFVICLTRLLMHSFILTEFKFVLIFVLTVILSYAMAWGINHIPKAGCYILYMR